MIVHQVSETDITLELEWGPGQPDRALVFRILNELRIATPCNALFVTICREALTRETRNKDFTDPRDDSQIDWLSSIDRDPTSNPGAR